MHNLKKIVFVKLILFVCLWCSCSSPADVDAWRVHIDENPGAENTIAIKFAANYMDFGYVTQNGSVSQQLPIYNISMVDTVVIHKLEMRSGNNGFKVEVTGGLPLRIPPGQGSSPTYKVFVEFFPRFAGEFMDTVFVNGDRNNYIALHGLSGPNPRPQSVSIQDINFGEVPVGKSIEATTEIRNFDMVPLIVTIQKPFTEESPFSMITPPGDYRIDQGSSKSFTVMFAPKEEKEYQQQMKFYIRGATGQLNSTFKVTGKGK